MKAHRPTYTLFILVPTLAAALACAGAAQAQAQAQAQQDSAFLACEKHSDRGQRIACLEDALEAATASADSADSPPAASASPAVSTPSSTPVQPDSLVGTAGATAQEESPARGTMLERLRNFGQEESARVSTDTDGQEQLHDTITGLEKRNGLWIVTLSSGQIWMQEVARTMNLREGDEITIYQGGFGNGYRLAAKRLSGFIRVKRMK